VSGEAILCAENGNPLGGLGSAPNLAGVTALPDSLSGREGRGLLPFPENHSPALGLKIILASGPQVNLMLPQKCLLGIVEAELLKASCRSCCPTNSVKTLKGDFRFFLFKCIGC